MDKKKVTINPTNKTDHKYFQYTITVALNHEKIRKDLKRITKIKLFINKCKQEGINFPLEKDDWKKIEKNKQTILLNVLYAKKIYPAYISKYNSNHEKEVIRLLIPMEKDSIILE